MRVIPIVSSNSWLGSKYRSRTYSVKPKPKAWSCTKTSALSDEPVLVATVCLFWNWESNCEILIFVISLINKTNGVWLTLPFRFLIPANFIAGNTCGSCSQRLVWDVQNSQRWQLWGVLCPFRLHINHRTKTLCALAVHIFQLFRG